MCRTGHPNVCTSPFPSLGYKVNGGFEELFAVPENIFRLGFVNPIPGGLSFLHASLSEIIACCINAQNNVGVREGDCVLVLGSGPAGIIHTQLARKAGAAKVMLSQRSRPRLDLAVSRFPVDRAIASSEEDLQKAVMEETRGEGADVTFVCAPSAEAQEMAILLTAPRGRINFFGGLPKGGSMVSLDANVLHYKELFISGASSSLPEGNREALQLLADKTIDPEKLITHLFSIDEIVHAFDVAESKQGIKIVVTL
jgi:L-iditol 2-dehydrogenase